MSKRSGIAAWIFALALSPALAQTELRVGEASAGPGSQVLVPVFIAAGGDVTAAQFSLDFDPDALALVSPFLFPGDELTDHGLGASTQTAPFTVLVFSTSLSPLKTGDGLLAQVLFEVAGQPAEDSTTVILSGVQLTDQDGSSIDAITSDGEVDFSDQPDPPPAGANELVFPQVANGAFPGGNIAASLIFVNRTAAPVSVEAALFKSDSTPMVIGLTDGRSDSTFSLVVPARGSAFLDSDGLGELAAGYARVTSAGPIGGTILFSSRNPSGATVAEAGVGASPVGKRFSLPVIFVSGSSDTGVAISNLSAEAVEITLTLKDLDGSVLASRPLDLGPGEHVPRFASEFFDALDGLASFQGTIEVEAPVTVSAIAIKTKGPLLTTFPVVPVL